MIKKVLPWVILVSLSGVFQGCIMVPKNKNLKVYIHLEREELKDASLMVFNFKEPSYAEGSGAVVADLFHKTLLKTKKFRTISLQKISPWSRLGLTEEERLATAMKDGIKKNFKYILVGEILDYLYGGLNKTKVTIKVRIIELHTRKTIYYAENKKQNLAKDPSYPLETKLAEPSLEPAKLSEFIVKELVNKI